MQFISKEQLLKIFSASDQDVDLLNEILTKVVLVAIEESIKRLPAITGQLIKSSVALKRMTDKFFEDNPSLADRKELVQATIMKVEGEHPGWDYDKILSETASRANMVIKGIDLANQQQPPFKLES